VGVDLTGNVMIALPTSLEDEPFPTMGEFENRRRDESPTMVVLDDRARQPLVEEPLLTG
jgi:hypothetical protein